MTREEAVALLREASIRYEQDPYFHYRVRLAMDLVDEETDPNETAWRLVSVALLVAGIPDGKLAEPDAVALATGESERVREALQADRAAVRDRIDRSVL